MSFGRSQSLKRQNPGAGGAIAALAPYITGSAASIQTSAVLTHPVTIPAGDNGDLLLIIAAVHSVIATVVQTGWTVSQVDGPAFRCFVMYKIADGNDAVTFETATVRRSTSTAFRMKNAGDVFTATVANAGSTDVDFPALAPGVGVDNWLWFASYSRLAGNSGETGLAGYDLLFQAHSGSGISGTYTGVQVRKELGASGTDPGISVKPSADAFQAYTIGVRAA